MHTLHTAQPGVEYADASAASCCLAQPKRVAIHFKVPVPPTPMSLLHLQSDVVTRRSYAAQVRQVAEDSNDEDTFRICSRFLAQTSTPRLVYGLMLMPMTVLLWRFLELLDVLAAKGYLKPTLSLVDR